MLEVARSKLGGETFPDQGRVELRSGEADHMPIGDDEMDAAFAHMVLHYMPSPVDVIREMARIVRPGGVLVIVDFTRHSHEWMRQELGVVWMGFAPDELRDWFESAGLPELRIEETESLGRERDLPATFIASARKPAPSRAA
jgi:ArsR family transcriptional regulator